MTVLQSAGFGVALAVAVTVSACGGADSRESSSSETVTAARANPNATQVTLTVSPEPPVPPGTAVVWTAAGKGGTAPYSYKWFVSPDGGQQWNQLQDWSMTPTYQWTPPAGTYLMSVWIRSAGNAADEREDATSTSFAVTP